MLVKSPGWARQVEIAEAQKQNRQASVFGTKCTNMDMVLEQEFTKGEGAGIALFIVMPEIEIETLMVEIKELEDAAGNSTTS